MQMKTLSNYIKENSTSLEFYMINEGLFDWIKKFWNWLFDDAKKNSEAHGGNYRISPNNLNAISKDKTSNFKYDFCQLDKKNMQKILELLGDNFSIAKKYFENNIKSIIFSVKAKNKSDIDTQAFIFCDLKDKELSVKQIIFAQEIVQSNKKLESSEFVKSIVKNFDAWIKKNLKKYSLNQEIKSEVINKEKTQIKKTEEKPSTDKESKDKEILNKENKESLDKQESEESKDNKKQKFEKIDIVFEEIENIKEFCEKKIESKKYSNIIQKFVDEEIKAKDRKFRNFGVYNNSNDKKYLVGVIFGEIINNEQIKLSNCYFNPSITSKYDLSKEFISELANKQIEYFNNHKDFYIYDGVLGQKLTNSFAPEIKKSSEEMENDKTDNAKQKSQILSKLKFSLSEIKEAINRIKNSGEKTFNESDIKLKYWENIDYEKFLEEIRNIKPKIDWKNVIMSDSDKDFEEWLPQREKDNNYNSYKFTCEIHNELAMCIYVIEYKDKNKDTYIRNVIINPKFCSEYSFENKSEEILVSLYNYIRNELSNTRLTR